MLLRNAHYPGHWDAVKDSMWVALPAPPEDTPDSTSKATTGDEGWLSQLRQSIVSAADTPKKAIQEEETKEDKAPKKDADVSNFFESLLKDP